MACGTCLDPLDCARGTRNVFCRASPRATLVYWPVHHGRARNTRLSPVTSEGEFAGRVAIVTGAASGIGRATANLFCGQGAHVTGIDLQAGLLAKAEKELENFTAAPLDVTDHAALKSAVDETISRRDRIDIVVNNAGIEIHERIENATLDTWRKTHAVNLEAMYELVRYVAPTMIERRYGRIVNVASIQGFMTQSMVGAYAATKGGILAWTRSLAIDLAEYEILVNAVAPGAIHTPFNVIDGVDISQDEEFIQRYLKERNIPLGRMGEPAEIANVIGFLSGDRCAYITGATLVADGGLSIKV